MRLSSALTTGLSATAALVLLTACGGSDDGAAAGSSATATTTTGTSAPTTAPTSAPTSSSGSTDEQALAFCTEAETVLAEVGPAVENVTPETIPGALAQVVEAFDTLSPPAEIAPDFGVLRDAYADLLAAAQANDLTTPEGQTAFESVFTQVTAGATGAETAVGDWIATNCPAAGSPTG